VSDRSCGSHIFPNCRNGFSGTFSVPSRPFVLSGDAYMRFSLHELHAFERCRFLKEIHCIWTSLVIYSGGFMVVFFSQFSIELRIVFVLRFAAINLCVAHHSGLVLQAKRVRWHWCFFCTFFCRCIYHCPRSVCRCGRRMFLASSDTAENQTSYACRSAHDNDTLIMMHACTAVQNVLSSRAVRNP